MICDGTEVLDRIGLTPEKVRELVARHTLLPPERVIELVARKKQCYGRRGLPEVIVNAMIAEYRRTNSLSATGRKFNRTRQSMWQILHLRIGLNPVYKTIHEPLVYKGEKFTPGKNGYLRRTTSRRGENQLHRLIWIEHQGPIPYGRQVMFRDRNRRNCAIDNLFCVTRVEAATGRPSGNAWTKFYRGLGPRPISSPISSEKRRASLARVWANYTPRQRRHRLRGVHRRWRERRKLEEAA